MFLLQLLATVFWVSVYRSLTSLVNFFPSYFILFVAIINEIVFLISLFAHSSWVYRNAPRFWYIDFVNWNFIYLLFLIFLCDIFKWWEKWGHTLAGEIMLSFEEWVTDNRTQSFSQAGGWNHTPKLLGTANLGRKAGIRFLVSVRTEWSWGQRLIVYDLIVSIADVS